MGNTFKDKKWAELGTWLLAGDDFVLSASYGPFASVNLGDTKSLDAFKK